jgi:hypothetical protein
MFKKISLGFMAIVACVGGYFVLAAKGVAAAMPTATSTLDTIMETIVNTTVGLATTVFTTYWPYVLIIGIISGLIVVFTRFTHLGTGKGR